MQGAGWQRQTPQAGSCGQSALVGLCPPVTFCPQLPACGVGARGSALVLGIGQLARGFAPAFAIRYSSTSAQPLFAPLCLLLTLRLASRRLRRRTPRFTDLLRTHDEPRLWFLTLTSSLPLSRFGRERQTLQTTWHVVVTHAVPRTTFLRGRFPQPHSRRCHLASGRGLRPRCPSNINVGKPDKV